MAPDEASGRECYHCKQWIAPGEPHDCWTTTEAALTADLSEDLLEAWERLRETAVDLGEQRIYASHKSIVFSRRACYFFVRPKRSVLEVCVFLGRPVNAPQVRRIDSASRLKLAHIIHVRHRDEVEAPLTDWLREAYHFAEQAPARTATKAGTFRKRQSRSRVRSSKNGSGKKKKTAKAAGPRIEKPAKTRRRTTKR